jgi:hypothetical protein
MNRLLARCLSLLFLLPLAACAHERLVDVQVVDLDQGNWLNRFPYSGREYIEGRPGHRFSVSLHNVTGQRVLAVLSVDGVNAISGETAGSSQAGYVLEPYQQVEIRGWRKSYADVAEFYFTDLPDSYAARTGRPDDVGVIGVALYQRKPQPRPAPSPGISDSASGPQAKSAQERQLGTGHGRHEHSPAVHVTFERATSAPAQVLTLYYDSRANLVARGIIREPIHVAPTPRPFPGFVPDPQG